MKNDIPYQPSSIEEINKILKSLGIKQKFGEVFSFPLTIEAQDGTITEVKQAKILFYNKDTKMIVTVGKNVKNPKENQLFEFDVKTFKKHCKPVKAEDVKIDIKVEFVPAWQNRAIKNIELSAEFKKDFEKAMKEYYLEKVKKLKESMSEDEKAPAESLNKTHNFEIPEDHPIEDAGANGDISSSKKAKKSAKSKN